MTGALELLQQLLRTPPPELLRVLTTAGGVRQLAAAKDEPGGRSRSGSIVELIGRVFGRPLWSPLSRDSGPGAGEPRAAQLLAALTMQVSSLLLHPGTGGAGG